MTRPLADDPVEVGAVVRGSIDCIGTEGEWLRLALRTADWDDALSHVRRIRSATQLLLTYLPILERLATPYHRRPDVIPTASQVLGALGPVVPPRRDTDWRERAAGDR